MTQIATKKASTTYPDHHVSLLRRISVWHRAWREHHALRQLDGPALRDMGISPSDRDRITVSEIAARIRKQGF